ncbi:MULTISPECIES: hypothetical protein [unclassified Mesorhizobium]|uniref:hypothetical protein n=1 Tax=unclassified Mesorhizobium TaxID=325217 RepID=UPI0015E39651|nr:MULTISPECIES: hypothetical protein [unclassified Mesorhizobium]MBZ9913334.1 hypothetical protein [Mesorhizobium sp. CA16]
MKADNPSQSRAFIEKAREIEADEKKSAADALMGKLAHMPPDHKQKPKGNVKKKLTK